MLHCVHQLVPENVCVLFAAEHDMDRGFVEPFTLSAASCEPVQ